MRTLSQFKATGLQSSALAPYSSRVQAKARNSVQLQCLS